MGSVEITAKFANNIFDRILGLIGKQTAHGLLIRTRFGIHTFFLKFPIDIVVLDEKGNVAIYKEDIKPYRFFFWNPKYDRVLEMPKGTIEKNHIRIGTTITVSQGK